MKINKKEREVYPGDLIQISPKEFHGVWLIEGHAFIHGFNYAVAEKDEFHIKYSAE